MQFLIDEAGDAPFNNYPPGSEPNNAATAPGYGFNTPAPNQSFREGNTGLSQKRSFSMLWQQLLDRSTIFLKTRWAIFAVLTYIFLHRIYILQRFFIIVYGLAIFELNLFLGFLTPLNEPEHADILPVTQSPPGFSGGGGGNPVVTNGSSFASSFSPLSRLGFQNDGNVPQDGNEFKPFFRRLPEFQFWYSSTNATLIALFLTLFSFFDIPVYWPVLLFYFIILFVLTMKKQIQHMVRYRYVPFTIGKQKYKQNQGYRII